MDNESKIERRLEWGRDSELVGREGVKGAATTCHDNHEERVAKAIKELRENPESKIMHVAAHQGLTKDTLHNRYPGSKSGASRANIAFRGAREVGSWMGGKEGRVWLSP